MKRYVFNPQCAVCNRFMSWQDVRDGMTWTHWGSANDTEPPEPGFAHKECYEAQDETSKALTRRASWIPPAPVQA